MLRCVTFIRQAILNSQDCFIRRSSCEGQTEGAAEAGASLTTVLPMVRNPVAVMTIPRRPRRPVRRRPRSSQRSPDQRRQPLSGTRCQTVSQAPLAVLLQSNNSSLCDNSMVRNQQCQCRHLPRSLGHG